MGLFSPITSNPITVSEDGYNTIQERIDECMSEAHKAIEKMIWISYMKYCKD